jgi:enediyne biosynthesis protein E4
MKPKDVLSVAAAWFDYDNDGKLDLMVSNYTVWTPQIDKICAVNGQEYYCHPKVYPSVANRLYHNIGNGRFEDVTDSSGIGKELGKGMGIAIADFNGDGYMDVFVANDTVRNFLFVNRKNGTFKESGYEWGVAYDENGNAHSSMGADAKDYDNDGWPDLFYNNLKGQIWGLFRNSSGKYMNYVSGLSHVSRLSEHSSGWSNGFVDYNNDGWKDLYSSNGDIDNMGEVSRQPDTMFENVDGKEFRDVSAQLGPDFNHAGFQRGSAFADLNNDGFPDLAVTSLAEKPRILMNSADNGNHWLLVNTIGRRSNRDGIGAALKLTTASGRTLYNHVTTSAGFMSSSDKRVHFGLGTEKAIDSLEIRWPSGIVQTLKKVKADKILTVTEPER